MSADRRLYVCPDCGTEHSGIPSGYEDGGGEYGESLTPILDCAECGHWFTGDEGFVGFISDEQDESEAGQ